MMKEIEEIYRDGHKESLQKGARPYVKADNQILILQLKYLLYNNNNNNNNNNNKNNDNKNNSNNKQPTNSV